MEFRDLKKQYERIKEQIDSGIGKVCQSTHFISGPQVQELEKELAAYVGVKHCITCANGTDAITLGLMAWDIGAGDAVFVPDFTFFSSGECPAFAGATPIFVDVDKLTFNIDPSSLECAIEKVLREGKYVPKVVISVDLFGQPADYEKIRLLCKKYNLLLLEDGAQGFGGAIQGKMACSFGDISTTSFFPAKPLGCYGDGGAVFTDNDEWAALIRSLAVHGKSGEDKYNNVRIGINSRLDTIQAVVLLEKLKVFREYELADINWIAKLYDEELKDLDIICPFVPEGFTSSWAQYTIQLPSRVNRKNLQEELKTKGIPTMIYYIKPMHQQGAFERMISSDAYCPVTEYLCNSVLSLPMHPYLEKEEIIYITDNLRNFLKSGGTKNEI